MKTDLGRKLEKMGRDLLALAALAEQAALRGADPDGAALPGGCVYRADRAEARLANGTTVRISKSEGRILDCLLESRESIVSRDALLAALFGGAADGVWSRTVDEHVANLRRKLGRAAIRTAHGKGYMIDQAESLQ